MTLTKLVSLLRATGYPVAYSHFTADDSNPAPQPPYIAYTTPSTDHFIADNQVYQKVDNVDIELYTFTKDLEAEQAIETMLDDNKIPYQAVQVWIESEKIFQKNYEIRMI